MNTPLLDISDLTVVFGRGQKTLEVVRGLSFMIGVGEIVALVGESGSGKSVTALSIMGLLPEGEARISHGRILFQGHDLVSLDDEHRRRVRGARVGMIFQEPMTSLNPVLTIGRQMTEALVEHRGLSARDAIGRAVDMLGRVGIPFPAERLQQYPHEFSGGMRQRVMIAMAMVLEPALLIADEPTTALDVTVQAQILDLMRELTRDLGTSLLLITHDMGVVAEMADRVVVMRNGSIVETGAVRPLFATPREPYTRALMAAVPRVDDRSGSLARPLTEEGRTSAPALTLSGITKSFPGSGWIVRSRSTMAVDNVRLEVMPGETLALVGESGSGKSTLGRIAVRLIEPDAGRIKIDGEDITCSRGRRLRDARRRIQIVFQDPFASLDPRFTASRIVAEPILVQGLACAAEANEQAVALLRRVGLSPEMAKRLPHEFSGGQRQRVAIARALSVNPKIVVADEPTSSLDVSIQAQVIDLLSDLQTERKLAFLFITHDLAVVRRIAHRVAVMRHGRLVELGAVDVVLSDPRHPYTRSLVSAAPIPDPMLRGRPRLAPPTDAGTGPLIELAPNHWVAN
jgi:ABC-type glutathione transport system ATPase component